MKIGFMGGGKMAEAMVRGILSSELVTPSDLWIADIDPARRTYMAEQYGANVCADNAVLVKAVDVVILAVKPQQFPEVLDDIAENLTEQHLVVSIAAGKGLDGIANALGVSRVVRVMPNLPATVGEGMSVYCAGAGATDDDCNFVRSVLASFGRVMALPEEQFDAVTAVSGSGPAFFAYFLAQVIKAGEALGLTAADAALLAMQTMRGTALLLDQQNISPIDLVQAVSSKKGTTEAGMAKLSSPILSDLVQSALQAAADRSRELSE